MPRWRLPVLGATAALLVLLGFVGLAELTGPHPPLARDVVPEPLREADGAIHLAGTGSWLPLARDLARNFEKLHPGISVVVHESIGSRGGRRAAAEGVIDIGLISTPEGEVPQPQCCDVIPVAVGAVVFTAHSSVKVRNLDQSQIVAIFSGRMTTWPDGEAVVPLLRERGDSATAVAEQFIPGLAKAIAGARSHGRWPMLLTDADMARALEATPGSVGVHDLGSIRLEHPELRVLTLNGLEPSIERLADGSYPLRRTLALYVPRPWSERVEMFVDFVRSPEGRQVLLRTGGYLPLPPEER